MKRADPGSISTSTFDLIVIGGGINGVAIARDASMRGMSVCLVEKDDLSSGTSAWSSRLIHGGLRYLEHREFALVRESLRERERLLGNAPHLVSPLAMVVPIHDGAKRGPLLIRAGMAMYDGLSWDKSLPLHRMLNREKALDRTPGLSEDGLRGSAVYYDAQVTFAERLVIENALSAYEHGAQIVTRAEVTGIVADGAVVRGVEVVDGISGEAHHIYGRIVVNVAGPWVDRVLAGTPKGAIEHRYIGGTKGSHVVVERWEGAPDEAIYYESRTDGRPILILPWNGMMLLGSTDLRFDGDLDRVEASGEEIDYLLGEANALFAGLQLTANDVLYSYAGVRPLPYQPDGATGAITRQHIIKDHAPGIRGLWSVIGGKLTTHRSLAEEVVDMAARVLAIDVDCLTAETPLPGAAGIAFDAFRVGMERQVASLGMSDRLASRLVSIYGSRAEHVLDIARAKPELAEVFDEESGAIVAELVFGVQSEMAISLADLLLRRTMVAYGSHAGIGADEAAMQLGGKALGWTKPRQRKEIDAYRNWIARYRPRLLAEKAE